MLLILLFELLLFSWPFIICSDNFSPLDYVEVNEELSVMQGRRVEYMINENENLDFDCEDDRVPSFVEDRMTKKELLHLFKEILRSNFNPLSITVYLNGTDYSEFLQVAMLINGMLSQKREDLFQEFVNLWGYYLTLQVSPDLEASNSLLELIKRNRYPTIFDGLVTICKSLNIISPFTKNSIIKGLTSDPDCPIKLKVSNFKYLYNLSTEFVDEKLKGIPHDYMIEAVRFENLLSN